MFQRFSLQGNRPHMRTEQEMANINKAAGFPIPMKNG